MTANTTPTPLCELPVRLPRRLPRSNEPLPDESLTGYLINLAYRLDMTPSDLLLRTGLKERTAPLLDVQYPVSLPPRQTAAFASATGLTETEVRGLTLERFLGNLYDEPQRANLARTLHSNLWINLATTRYCPQCLHSPAAQHDAIEHAHWRTQWLTPWALACTQHRVLLLDTCPECGTLTGRGERHAKSAIANAQTRVQHPAACRAAPDATSLCGHRLDHVTAPLAPETVLSIQRTLDDLMTGKPSPLTTLGQTVTGPQYLRDLRLTMLLIQMARDDQAIPDNTPYRPETTDHIQSRAENLRGRTQANRTLTQPPTNTRVATGLLIAASTLIADPANISTLSELARQAADHEHQPWKKAHGTARASAALSNALLDTKNAITDPRRIRAFTTTPSFTYTHEHVPAYLASTTHQKHFSDIDTQHERAIRRWVPIALTRLVTDLSTREAAALLGYDTVAADAATARASNAFDTLGQDELRQRVAAIAEQTEHGPRINYQQRRNHFDENWLIPDHHWQTLKTTLYNERLARADTPWTRRRPAYAAWIWSLITHGDSVYAPMIQTTTGVRRSTGGTAKDISDLQRRTPPAHHQVVQDLASRITADIN